MAEAVPIHSRSIGNELPKPPDKWYHGKLKREEAEEILENDGEEGTFLVRESTTSPGQYALSVFSKGRVHHIQISQVERDACYSIDEGNLTVIFGLDELIKAYSYPAELVVSNEETLSLIKPLLCDSPPKATLRHGVTNLLHRSVVQANTVVLQGLIPNYPNMEGRNELGQTALHLATIHGHNAILEMLITAGLGELINARDSEGHTALHYACALNRPETVKLLMREGASPTGNSCRQSDRFHPLHEAASQGFIYCVQELLEYGAALRPRTTQNKIPLDLAEEGGFMGTADYLRTYKPREPFWKKNQWYHGDLERRCASDLLEQCLEENENKNQACFLIRRSTRPEYKYALCIIYQDSHGRSIKNFFGVEKHNEFYFIDDGPYFPSLPQLVDHYSRWMDGLPVTLQVPIGPNQTFPNRNRRSTSPSLIPPPLPRRTPRSSPCGLNSLNFINLNNNESRLVSETVQSIPSEWIELGQGLGGGDFGIVNEGTLKIPGKPQLAVAVKRLNEMYMSSIEENREEFLKEVKIMMELEHEHIVKLIGFCFEPNKYMMVQELMSLGSMQSYLRESREDVSVDTLRLWASQICKGMVYLSESLVHRDLAARNILLARLDLAKISDFGLSRKLGEHDYYTASEGGHWPVKWYSPESVTRGKFSQASDVWSFGVTLWEMYSYGETPWVDFEGREVVELILDGKRMEQPEACPDNVYEIMLQCWAEEPENRIKFQELAVFFGSSEV